MYITHSEIWQEAEQLASDPNGPYHGFPEFFLEDLIDFYKDMGYLVIPDNEL